MQKEAFLLHYRHTCFDLYIMKKVTESVGIGARVCFAWKGYEEKPFWYSTDLSAIYKLGLKPDHDKLFIQKGVMVDFGSEGRGRIVEVQAEVGDEYLVQGISIRGHGKDFPFTLDVIFVVEKV
jgi:hypothetical protein